MAFIRERRLAANGMDFFIAEAGELGALHPQLDGPGTATAMLTRAMGIPSRLAFGWSGGRYYEGPNFYVFRGREAHAWTEIYLQNHGWVIFDTTPPSHIQTNQDSEEPAPEDLFGDTVIQELEEREVEKRAMYEALGMPTPFSEEDGSED